MPYKIKFKVGDQIGTYKILEVLGVKQIKSRKKKAFDVFYKVQCTKCLNIKEVMQKSIAYKQEEKAFYCMNCPPEFQRNGRQEKKDNIENKRNKEKYITDEENKLFRLMVFKENARS